MSRGFVTIATGDARYYRLAANLLDSYHLHCPEPLPFAIICDRENEYTRRFDPVLTIRDPQCSYTDKFVLPALAPFDETIFIDADCLAYADLNDFWGAFEDGPAFSAFGKDYPASYTHAWFKRGDVGELGNSITSIPDFNGGVYYLRKSRELEEFDRTSRYIVEHYHDYKFKIFSDPSDEPVFSLAMAVHGFKSAGERSLPVCFYPHATQLSADIISGRVRFDDIYQKEKGIIDGAHMVHWSIEGTKRPPYLMQEYRLHAALRGESPGKARLALVNAGVTLCWGVPKVPGKAKRIAKKLLGRIPGQK